MDKKLRNEIEAFCGCENDCDYFETNGYAAMRTNRDGNSLAELVEYLVDCGFKNVNQILGDIRFNYTSDGCKNEIVFTGVSVK